MNKGRSISDEIRNIESLLDILRVDTKTGMCYWKVHRGSRATIGSVAGTTNKRGYTSIGYNGKSYYIHRIVFYVSNGYLPAVVDHKHGVEAGNGIDNLQEATQQQNCMKAKMPKNNTSGFRGVFFDTSRGKWVSRIKINRHPIFLGRFDTPEQASEVYEAKAKELFGEFYNAKDC